MTETETPFVTVVMAVYNSEKTLKQSMESVLNQTYSQWRMICVNDGSTDRSLEVLNDYALKDKRITVLSKENGGPASARAAAFEITTTPYVIMLDSDDCYTSDLLQSVVECAIATNADAVAPNLLIEQADGSYMDWNKRNGITVGTSMRGMEAFEQTFIGARMHGVNLWKTSLVKKYAVGNNATYNTMNADEYIQRVLFLNCRNVVFSNGAYIYKNNGESITKELSIRQLGYLDTCRHYITLCKTYHVDKRIVSICYEYYLRHVIHLQIRLFKDGDTLSAEQKKMMTREIKKAWKDVVTHKDECRFADKGFPWLYKTASTSGYGMFLLSCYFFGKIKNF